MRFESGPYAGAFLPVNKTNYSLSRRIRMWPTSKGFGLSTSTNIMFREGWSRLLRQSMALRFRTKTTQNASPMSRNHEPVLQRYSGDGPPHSSTWSKNRKRM
uniref:Uncharacterized protein n=1 Tax=Mycena chlorophos TaxID=658473 RepID=A0ABQ0LFJ6_MYCCL|nr:predicted protein [Mycena chlorophos]